MDIEALKTLIDRPSLEIDLDEVNAYLDTEETCERAAALQMLDDLMLRFDGAESITLFRRIAVCDDEAFVASLMHDAPTLGSHWSHSHRTECVMDETGAGTTILCLEGTIGSDQVCWVSTFLQRLRWPLEEEILFEGEIALSTIRNDRDGTVHDFDNRSFPTTLTRHLHCALQRVREATDRMACGMI